MAKTFSNQVLKANSIAPPFSLKGVDAKKYTLKDFSGKCLLVVFICNHCPYVKARIGDLTNLRDSFSPTDLSIVGINSNDPLYSDEGFENMIKFAEKYTINFPYLLDDSQTVAKLYGAVCTPDPFLFNNLRRLVYHGKINDALEPEANPKIPVMENNIKLILEGGSIVNQFDPSIGCSIKWKT
jgi:peroxiredoxin